MRPRFRGRSIRIGAAAGALALFGVTCGLGGSLINTTPILFSTHVAQTVNDYCTTCHKPGGIGPFALTTYDEIFARRGQMAAAMGARVMPPWGAEAVDECPTIQNSHWLPNKDIERFQFWVANGAPQGPPRPPLIGRTEGFTIDQPDLIARSAVAHTPVFQGGNDTYPCLLAKVDVTSSTYIDEFAFVPSNAGIAHHAIVVRLNEQTGAYADWFDEHHPVGQFDCGQIPNLGDPSKWEIFQIWSAGGQKVDFSRYNAKPYVSSGPQRFVFQMHYSASTGGTGSDQPELKIKAAPPAPVGTSYTQVMLGGTLGSFPQVSFPAGTAPGLPPQTANIQIPSFAYLSLLPPGSRRMVLGVLPHMHKFGRTAEMRIVRADGRRECLVRVPKYNFNWQWSYMFSVPVILEAGDTIESLFVFDTTGYATPVSLGEQSNDEMAFGFTYEAAIP